jgi:hypothetical protein
LLLALVAHGEGVAAHVLAELGVDLEKAAVATLHARFPFASTMASSAPPLGPAHWPPVPPKPN